jgi:choline transport protein
LNAIVSSSIVFIQTSYCVPIALVFFRGRKILDQNGPRTFNLGKLGWFVNGWALIFGTVTTVFLCVCVRWSGGSG